MAHCNDHDSSHHDIDPTLDSCCARDQAEQVSADAIKARLQAVDRSMTRAKLASEVFLPPEDIAVHQQLSDDDAELQVLRQARIQQLRHDARRQTAQLKEESPGVLKELSLASLNAAIETTAEMVCHTYLDGMQACEQLNEHLEDLARTHDNVLFVFVRMAPLKSCSSHDFLDPRPGLIVFRKRSVIGMSPLEAMGDAMCIQESKVDRWLQKLLPGSMLIKNTADGSQDEESEGEAPCEICGRTYQHEHIRSMYHAHAELGSSTSDSDE